MNVRRPEKCTHCLLRAEPGICDGQNNIRVCHRADPTRPADPPSLFRQAASFAVAMIEHAAAGFPMATHEQKASRLAICQACEHFNPEKQGCRKCGCAMDMKSELAGSSCPVGKWGPLVSEPAEPVPAELTSV